jgi:hypothetical protein
MQITMKIGKIVVRLMAFTAVILALALIARA